MLNESDQYDERSWPADLIDRAEVKAWIAAVLPEILEVKGPICVHQAKEWGVTASFAVVGQSGVREVVFKAEQLPLFAGSGRTAELLARACPGAVPEILAWQSHGEGNWALFAAFDGHPVEANITLDTLTEIARTLAHIQVAVVDLPDQKAREKLPRLDVRLLPRLYETVIRDVRERHLAYWAGEGIELAEQFSVPRDVLVILMQLKPSVIAWTEELLAGDWPNSIDHVDLHCGNVVRKRDGEILIYDWEEANLSCPFFSLDRLLDDARPLDLLIGSSVDVSHQLPYTPAERAVRSAYLAEIPWGNPAERERGFDLAMCLGPIKTAYEAIGFAEALGWEEGCPHILAWALGRALPRWRAML
jgi:Phosphotransferase enzyme family